MQNNSLTQHLEYNMRTIIELIHDEIDYANTMAEFINDNIHQMEEDFEHGGLTNEEYADLEDYWYERLYNNDVLLESIRDRLAIAETGRGKAYHG